MQWGGYLLTLPMGAGEHRLLFFNFQLARDLLYLGQKDTGLTCSSALRSQLVSPMERGIDAVQNTR